MNNITPKDRNILRKLAEVQLEAANLPIMQQRRENWTRLNDLQSGPPMIHFETWTFEADLLPSLQCETEAGRSMEIQLRRELLNHERIGDDRVVPDFFAVGWKTWFHLFDMTVKVDHAMDSQGRDLGHQFRHLITDLETDLPLLRPSTFGVDRDGSHAWMALAEETFGDILPVRMTMGSPGVCLTQDLVHYMGMEPMFYAMMDMPDEFHTLMRRMTDDHIRYLHWLESENLLLPNNGHNGVGNGTFGFSRTLPGKGWKEGDPIRLDHLWGFMDSQETVGVSPAMFEKFFFPYYAEVGALFGLLSYGCCEPVDAIWTNCLSKLGNLRKISISPWCDEVFMGAALKGKPVIYHRKPSPNFVGVGHEFDEEVFMQHIVHTLKAAEGCHLEFSFRDVYTTGGNPEKPRRAVELLRQAIRAHWNG